MPVTFLAAISLLTSCLDENNDEVKNPTSSTDSATDASEDSEVARDSEEDTAPVETAMVLPTQKKEITFDGDVMSLLKCYPDEYVDESTQSQACYVTQFIGNNSNPPSMQLRRLSGTLPDGLKDDLVVTVDDGSSQMNVNGGSSALIDGAPYFLLPYNSVSSDAAATGSELTEGTDTLGSFVPTSQDGRQHGVLVYDNHGAKAANFDLTQVNYDGFPVTGPVNSTLLDDKLYVGGSCYGNGSEEYIGHYGMIYGKSVIVTYSDALNDQSYESTRALVDDEGNTYFEMRSMDWNEDDQVFDIIAVDGKSLDTTSLDYDPLTDSLVIDEEETALLADTKTVGMMLNHSDSGQTFLTGDADYMMVKSSDGSSLQEIPTAEEITFISGANTFGNDPAGAYIATVQAEIDASTVKPLDLLCYGDTCSTISPTELTAAKMVMPNISWGGGVYGLAADQPLTLSIFSGTTRNDTSSGAAPWSSSGSMYY